MTLKIVGILLIFDVAGLQAFDFPKSLFSRAIEWLLIGVIAALVARHGIGIIPRTRLHLIAAGLVLATAISALFAENTYLALYGDRDRYLGLTFVVDMAVLYLAVAVGFRRGSDWAVLALGVALASFFILVYAWIQFFGLDPIPWSDDPSRRPFSTIGHPDHLGHVLSILFGTTVAIAVIGGLGASIPLRIGAAILCLLVAATAGIVATRGTLLGFAAVLAVLPLALLRSSQSRRSLMPALIIGALSIGFVAALLVLTPLGDRIRAADNEGRLALFRVAALAFEEQPIVGYGPDSFAVAYPRHRAAAESGDQSYNSSAHNWLLQTAATTGAVGLLATVAFFATSLMVLWRNLIGSTRLVAASLLLSCVAYWAHASVAVGSISVDWLPWVALGAAASSAPQQVHVGRRGLTLAVTAVALIVATVGALSGFQAVAANDDAGRARDYAEVDAIVSAAAAESALRRDPGRAQYWGWLGAAYSGQGRQREAASAYEGAATRAPHDATYWLALSSTAFAAESYELALASAVTAIAVDPSRNFDFYATQAASRVTDGGRARDLLEKAVQLRDTAPLHLALAQTLLKLGDTAGARRHAGRVLELNAGNAEALRILRLTGG